MKGVHVNTPEELREIDPEFADLSESEAAEKLKEKLSSQRWRLNHLYKIIDEAGNVIQFKMNWAQMVLYLALWYMSIILKSRQHGMTTFVCIFFLDTCLFNSNTAACIIAHNKSDAEEFFNNKIKFAFENLPQWLQDSRKPRMDSVRQYKFSNGSSIRVTTSGRSGTYQLVHVSEYGKMCAKFPEKAREVKTGTLNTVHPGQIVIIESTAEGKEGQFYEYCKIAKDILDRDTQLTKLDMKLFFFPWYKNPLNVLETDGVIVYDYQKEYFKKIEAECRIRLTPEQKAWYVKKWNQQGDDIQQEHPSTFDEAFNVAIQGAYYISEFRRIRKEGRITRVGYNPNHLVDTWWDLGYNDINAIWFTQNYARQVHVIDYYQNEGEGLLHYADVLRDKGYRYDRWVAPHDISVHEYVSGKTRQAAALELGIKFEVAGKLSKESQIEASRQMLGMCVFDEEKTAEGIEALEAYRKEYNEKTGTYRNRPLHNWASNGADAFHTLAVAHSFTRMVDGSKVAERRERSREKANPKGWT